MLKVTRKQQREKLRKNFLGGVARRPHIHSSSLNKSLKESTSSAEQGSQDIDIVICIEKSNMVWCF